MYIESEIKDQWANGEATQIHHIFPKSTLSLKVCKLKITGVGIF